MHKNRSLWNYNLFEETIIRVQYPLLITNQYPISEFRTFAIQI